jgi:hypothetical protein
MIAQMTKKIPLSMKIPISESMPVKQRSYASTDYDGPTPGQVMERVVLDEQDTSEFVIYNDIFR